MEIIILKNKIMEDGKGILYLSERDYDDYAEKIKKNITENSALNHKQEVESVIKKYEQEIVSAEYLKEKGTGAFSSVPSANDIERLNARIQERKKFIKDLQDLFNKK